MVFNATFNNISVRSWWSVLLVWETGVPEKNHSPVARRLPLIVHIPKQMRVTTNLPKSQPKKFQVLLHQRVFGVNSR
jgi:hypothetical protein